MHDEDDNTETPVLFIGSLARDSKYFFLLSWVGFKYWARHMQKKKILIQKIEYMMAVQNT